MRHLVAAGSKTCSRWARESRRSRSSHDFPLRKLRMPLVPIIATNVRILARFNNPWADRFLRRVSGVSRTVVFWHASHAGRVLEMGGQPLAKPVELSVMVFAPTSKVPLVRKPRKLVALPRPGSTPPHQRDSASLLCRYPHVAHGLSRSVRFNYARPTTRRRRAATYRPSKCDRNSVASASRSAILARSPHRRFGWRARRE